MTKIKHHLFLWFVLTVTFTVFMFLCAIVNSQVRFFANYREVYEQKQVVMPLANMKVDTKDFQDSFFKNVQEKESVTFRLPAYNENTDITMIFPQRFLQNLEMIKGTFFSPDEQKETVIIGKNVWKSLSKEDQEKGRVMIYGKTFKIQGILSESPYDNTILLNGNAAIESAKIVKNIEEINVAAATYDEAKQLLHNFLKYLPVQPEYMGEVIEAQSNLGETGFSKIFEQYRMIFIQLFIVALLSISIHYYQRFDAWRLELGIRKMVGANTVQLVKDTFKKFFLQTSIAFGSAVAIYLSVILIFRTIFAYSLSAVLMAILQVLLIYSGLLLILFFVSIFYVKNVSVAKILAEAGE